MTSKEFNTYADGMDAYFTGIPYTSNPFRNENEIQYAHLYCAWSKGWRQARDESEGGA